MKVETEFKKSGKTWMAGVRGVGGGGPSRLQGDSAVEVGGEGGKGRWFRRGMSVEVEGEGGTG